MSRISTINRATPPGFYGDEYELAQTAAGGDSFAQEDIVERLIEPTRRKLAYLTRNAALVEDLTQVSLMKTLKYAHTYRGDCSLNHWAGKIALRVFLKHLEKKKRRGFIFSRFVRFESSIAPSGNLETGEEVVGRKDLSRKLATVLAKLSNERRLVVVMHSIGGYTVPEIASVTDASEHTVRDRLRKGRALLRKHVLADPSIADWVEAWRK